MLLLVCNLLFYLSFVASPFALQSSIGNKTWRYKLFHKGFKTPRRVEVIKSKNHGVSRILKYKDILRIVLRASKINCARNQVSNIMKPFFNFILIFRLRTNGEFSEIFRVYSKLNQYILMISSNTLSKTFKSSVFGMGHTLGEWIKSLSMNKVS